MNYEITVDSLTTDSVSIKTQGIIVQDGAKYEVGLPHRCAYANSVSGRAQLQAEVAEPYYSAVMSVWGDTPTVEETEWETGASEE